MAHPFGLGIGGGLAFYGTGANIAAAVSDAETLAGSETDALAIVYTDDHFKATTGFNGSVFCVDSGTPANDYSNSPTTETASYFTYTSPSPKMILHDDGVLQYAAHNLCPYSEDATNWSTNNATASSASLIVENSSTAEHGVSQSHGSTVTGATYRIYAEMKAAGRNFARLGTTAGANTYCFFNLGAGTVATPKNVTNTAITDLGDGWYRCEFRFVATATSGTALINIANVDDNTSYAGDGSSGIQFRKVHLHTYPADTTYLKTTSASRFADCIEFNSSGTSLGLLVEPSRTNLLTYSSQFDNAAWTKTNTSISANSVAAPNGLTLADKLVEGSSTAVFNVTQSGGTATTTTASVFVKSAERNWFYLNFNGEANAFSYFNASSGSVGTSGAGATTTVTAYPDGWYRVTLTFTLTSTRNLEIGLASADNTSTYAGDGSSGLYIWGAQLEVGSSATSPIETYASSVTRAADNISKATSGFPFGTTYTQYIECEVLDLTSTGAGRSLMAIDNGTSANEFIVYRDASSANVAIYATSGGGTQISTTAAGTLTSGGNRVAFAVDTNDAALVLDGTVEFTDNTVTLIAATTVMRIGYNVAGNGPGHMYVKSHLFVPRRVSDADMQTLTSTGALP